MPLQKSYSERVGLTKGRPPWQRSHSHPVNPLVPRTNLPPVSEVTKNKLSRFQYQPPAHGPDAASDAPPVAAAAAAAAAAPLTRLNWRDLAEPSAAAEDRVDTSPNDKILWSNQQDLAYMDVSSPIMGRRKRVRSSSPVSSPPPAATGTPAVNVEGLAKALKLPHADPTLELWDRYANAGSAAANPVLAQLMAASSPKSSKYATPQRDEGSLRRAASCGLNWTKRRRVEKSRLGSQGSGEQRELEAASKSSLVTALLDSVNSSLRCPVPDGDAPAPETPSPKKRCPGPAVASSPCRAAAGAAGAQPSSSDYGDDDFDDDTFIEIEAAINGDASQAAAPGGANGAGHSPRTTDTSLQEAKDADDFGHLDDGDDVFDGDEALLGHVQRAQPRNAPPAATPKTPRSRAAPQGSPADDFGDDFDGDIDFDAVELAATQTVQQQATPSAAAACPKAKTIQRYLVTSVLDESQYADAYGNARSEKILVIRADTSKAVQTVHLRGAWFDTPAHAGSYVHIIGDFSARGQCIVDDARNLVILHPDQLISATVVADSFGCMRRAVLQDRVKATSEASPPLVYGTMLHEIFQEALLANQWHLPFLAKLIDRITGKHVEDLYTIKVGMATAREHLQSKMTELSCWAKAFVASQPQADAVVEDRHGKKANMAVTKLLDVEEHVWSPMYGLKGNIDATVEVIIADGKQRKTLTVPFEVKTGKHANSNHMAQTALYTLLLSDRYDINIACGVLYYMETSKTMRIPAIRNELRHMVMQRNRLACHIRERSVQLPPMLKSKHMCGKCYAKTTCFTYHRLADDGDGETSGMGDKFDEVVKHLTPTHRDFFVKWENLLTKEEKESQRTKRELWTMTSTEREAKSRCFADVVIEEGSASVDADNPRINRFHYTFVKRVPRPGFSFLESELSVGEPVVVSDEEGHFALAIGYVSAVSRQRISVAVDRRLHNARIRQPGFDESDNQVFASIMATGGPSAADGQVRTGDAPVRYRLDQDEFSNGMATVRNNLVQMMANDAPAAPRVRSLIVDLAPPRFKPVPTQYAVADRDSLNVDQRRAIEKVMSAQDYALVLGMPGTGKTTTIAHIIRALVAQGKTVLLTSHTHTAVDNILLKLKADKIPLLRLGAPAKVHPEVQGFARLAGQPGRTLEEIKETWHGAPVVATTCLGINHQVFLERSFDYCIVDEASQITLPICAGPIRMANAFVLVGDHNQLPPVVRNDEAREGGLDVSLFKLLSDAHPQSVVSLEHQYRMCADIMALSNTLIYNGRLRCGYDALKTRKLDVPRIGALALMHHDAASLALLPGSGGGGGGGGGAPRSFCAGPGGPAGCWLHDLVDADARVRFVNTDTLRPLVREEAQGKRIVNPAEVRLVAQLVAALVAAGVPASEVGVMTHYRAQLSRLRDGLGAHAPVVEMHTTDRFQGRDKDVVVLSLVRSNDACCIGDLLKDWRRINVAFTRAKTKLLVVGSLGTLKHSGRENMLSRFVALMEERDWIYDLPADALDSHRVEEPSTPAAARPPPPPPPSQSPRKRPSPKRPPLRASQQDKENRRPSPKKARIGDRALLRGKLITRDILNEMTNGAYRGF